MSFEERKELTDLQKKVMRYKRGIVYMLQYIFR